MVGRHFDTTSLPHICRDGSEVIEDSNDMRRAMSTTHMQRTNNIACTSPHYMAVELT